MQATTPVTSHTLIRQAFAEHQLWIEERLGCSLTDTVLVRTHLVFSQLGFTMLGHSELACPSSREMEAVYRELESVALPPGVQPIVDLHERMNNSAQRSGEPDGKRHPQALSWASCPVAFRLRSLPSDLIAARVVRFGDIHEAAESTDDVLLCRREHAEELANFLAQLTDRTRQPAVRTLGETPCPIEPCTWEQLTLAPEVRTLLQQDFEAFFSDKKWYEQMRVPHRRGYLLHGPPGNGKTSAVRAMLTTRGLTAYQLRLFGKNTADEDLQKVFSLAAANSPAIVLLEDLDRAFPRSGHRESRVHLQTLLNCLDGVATEPGVIAVATANEPSLLDPAILRRPGRFDRVVLFGNPDAELRREYIVRMYPALAEHDLTPGVQASGGFSYAFMQEMYIMAAQAARCTSRPLTVTDFVSSAAVLRRGYQAASKKGAATGFIAGDGSSEWA